MICVKCDAPIEPNGRGWYTSTWGSHELGDPTCPACLRALFRGRQTLRDEVIDERSHIKLEGVIGSGASGAIRIVMDEQG